MRGSGPDTSAVRQQLRHEAAKSTSGTVQSGGGSCNDVVPFSQVVASSELEGVPVVPFSPEDDAKHRLKMRDCNWSQLQQSIGDKNKGSKYNTFLKQFGVTDDLASQAVPVRLEDDGSFFAKYQLGCVPSNVANVELTSQGIPSAHRDDALMLRKFNIEMTATQYYASHQVSLDSYHAAHMPLDILREVAEIYADAVQLLDTAAHGGDMNICAYGIKKKMFIKGLEKVQLDPNDHQLLPLLFSRDTDAAPSSQCQPGMVGERLFREFQVTVGGKMRKHFVCYDILYMVVKLKLNKLVFPALFQLPRQLLFQCRPDSVTLAEDLYLYDAAINVALGKSIVRTVSCSEATCSALTACLHSKYNREGLHFLSVEDNGGAFRLFTLIMMEVVKDADNKLKKTATKLMGVYWPVSQERFALQLYENACKITHDGTPISVSCYVDYEHNTSIANMAHLCDRILSSIDIFTKFCMGLWFAWAMCRPPNSQRCSKRFWRSRMPISERWRIGFTNSPWSRRSTVLTTG